MAKKSRTPPPPRRSVQSPQRRQEHATPEERRKLLFLVAFAALGLIGLAAVLAVFALGGGSGDDGDDSVAAAMRKAGCTFRSVAAEDYREGEVHVPSLDTKVTWNTFPPAAGPHYGEWAVWGFYTDPVEPLRVVHNEEHGAVVLWWGEDTPAQQVELLRDFYNESPESMFGTPIGTVNGQSLGSKVAITTWTGDPEKYARGEDLGTGHVAVCPRFDEAAFTAFRDAYRGRSPEGVPSSNNQPGQL